MKTTILYEQAEQKKISYDPLPITECRVRYYLKAESGKILQNDKTSQRLKAVIVPKWEINNWKEVDI